MYKKALLITHTFPPYVFTESYLCAKRMGNIPGIEVDVLTIDPFMADVREDEEIGLYAKEKFRNITRLKPPNWYKRLPFTRLNSLFSIPDAYLYLNPLYFPYLKDITQYDFVFTWSMYHSAHLLGRYVKKRYPSIQWIAHFSDPWVDNPFFKQNWLSKIINKSLERRVFEQADLLFFTSQETIDLVLKSYPHTIKKKSHIIPHAFDESLYPVIQCTNQDKFLILYIGNFYGARQPTGFIKALEIMYSTYPDIIKSLKIEFIGSFVSDTGYQIPEILRGIVSFREPVTYSESLKLMKEADLLLIIDAPFETSPFLPSKLVDYIGANKPIFGITPNGTSQQLIEEMGYLAANPNEPEDIVNKLIKMIERSRIENTSIHPSIRDRYTVHNIGKKILDHIERLV